MESDPLSNTPSENDRLEALLRAHFSPAAHPLADDGFSTRVLHALPAPAPTLGPAEFDRLEREVVAERTRRAWFGVAGAAAGLVTFYVANGGVVAFAARAMQTFEELPPDLTLPTLDADPLALATAAAITLVSLAFVYRSTQAPRKW